MTPEYFFAFVGVYQKTVRRCVLCEDSAAKARDQQQEKQDYEIFQRSTTIPKRYFIKQELI